MSPRRRRRLTVLAALLAAGAVAFALAPVPAFDAPLSTVALDRDGRLLAASIASDGQWRFPAPASLPPRYRTALLTFEDARFDHHPGVDPFAIGRAVVSNVKAGRVVSGASTLTMQVVRLSRPQAPRSLSEKLLEAILALRLEVSTSKADILRLYATHAPFGGNTVGLEAATWRYFGRPPADLTWAEAATLAVLPNAPALMHPGRHRDQLKAKRDRLLARLAEDGHLDEESLKLSMAEPLPDAPRPLPQVAPHALAKLMRQGGGRVLTSIDGDLQRRALGVLERHQAAQAASGVHNLAAAIVDNRTGALLAYHGNVIADREHEDYVDVADARRSTGSLLKPFLYEALFADGELLPEQLVPDVPLRIGGFAPQNYHRDFDGAVEASEALARSLNVPATSLLRDYGVPTFHARLTALGMTTLDRAADNYGLSLVLGGAEGRLVELTGLYATLARAGAGEDKARITPWLRPADRRAAEPAPLDPAASYLTLKALLDVKRPGVDGAWRVFPSSRKVSWKTGTSFGFRDAWAIGSSRHYTVGVWVGNADGEGRRGLTGFKAAAPVLFELFELLPPDPWFEQPPEVTATLVCAHSGMRASETCPSTRGTLTSEKGARSAPCTYCQTVHLDAAKHMRVHSDCESVHAMRHQGWFVLPPRQEWYFRKRQAAYRPLPPWREDCRDGNVEARTPMALINPKPNTRLYVPVELDGHRGRAVFEATHRDRQAAIHWHLDETFLGTTEGFHQLEVAPTPGWHTLTLVDQDGSTARRRFEVLDPQSAQGT
jgi:penicillin-binding protein 1C